MSVVVACAGAEGLDMRLGGEALRLRPSGALWLVATRTLVVADLHLEKGSFFARAGQMLPPYDSHDTLARLEAEVAATEASTLVFLGDSFHDRWAETRLPAAAWRRLAALGAGRALIWVLGNHDPDLSEAVGGARARVWRAGALVFSHAPSVEDGEGSVAGHLHPCAKVSRAGGVVRRRCFATDGRRLILPAFGAYAGGLNVRDAAFAGLLGRSRLAVVLGRDRVHPVPWRSLIDD